MLLSGEDGSKKEIMTVTSCMPPSKNCRSRSNWHRYASPALLIPLAQLFIFPPVQSKSVQLFQVSVLSAWLHLSCGNCPLRSWASSWSASASSGAWCCCISPSSSEPATRTVPCCVSRSSTLASATSKHWLRRTKVSWMVRMLEPWRLTVSSRLADMAALILANKSNLSTFTTESLSPNVLFSKARMPCLNQSQNSLTHASRTEHFWDIPDSACHQSVFDLWSMNLCETAVICK